MIPRFGFQSLAACLIGVALSFAPQVAQAHGHGGGFHGGGFHGGGFHGGGFRGGFYGGGFGYGGFGRGFYGGGIYAGRGGYYGGYRGFYPRFYGGFYPGYYGGFYPRYYGSYLNTGYYGMGYGGYGYGGYGGVGYGGYSPAYGNCTCGTSGYYSGYPLTATGEFAAGPSTVRVVSTRPSTSTPLLAYYLKNNPYNTPRNSDAVLVGAPRTVPASSLPADNLSARIIPAVLTDRVVPPAPAPRL